MSDLDAISGPIRDEINKILLQVSNGAGVIIAYLPVFFSDVKFPVLKLHKESKDSAMTRAQDSVLRLSSDHLFIN